MGIELGLDAGGRGRRAWARFRGDGLAQAPEPPSSAQPLRCRGGESSDDLHGYLWLEVEREERERLKMMAIWSFLKKLVVEKIKI